ncbi:unnamed protein product [Lactuca saligna]|uniref:Integrator complex subunit 4/Protein SIEL C-terminal Ig-like domain-containing protein n=1 Tax=Lactuca saligna TaxID=75948 RepID=A0AA36E9N3_LACSI|nr:unnamed protein product [Lactuca saligna]
MEQKLLSNFEQICKNQTKISLKSFSIARTLLVNPSTSDQTISSILQNLETLSTAVAASNHQFYHLHVITLLCEISIVRRHFSPRITTTLHSLSLHCPNITPRAAGLALSTSVSIYLASASNLVSAFSEGTEGLFLSLCFSSCVPVRQRLLSDVELFNVRPSLLLTVLTGFTKDPFPYVRKAALDGLIGLCKCIVVEDRGMIEGCYLRAVELLFDTEECVRCSAVHMVSEWGKFLVANSEGKSKRDWSDALYVQLCSMVRDMSMNVKIEAFNALGKLGMTSEYILMQTLSKKVLPITKEKTLHGQLSRKHSNLPASSAAGAFIHGLEDEFHEVRSCACYSMRMPAILSADFATGALGLLMDVLNDDSVVVRLQALETMHHMAVYGHLKVQEMHMHMFLGALIDMNSSIRLTARKVLRLTKLHDLILFKLVVDSLIQSLEKYPQDEMDVLSLVFDIGRNHGTFAISIIKEFFPEVDPSSECNWDFNNSKTAAHLVLAISIPLSHGKQQQLDLDSIPSIIYSYAVTILGRISRSLTGVMNQDTLLAYLSHCSRSSGPHPIELMKGEDKMVEDDVATKIDTQITCPVSVRLDMVHNNSDGDSETLDNADNYIKFIFANVVQIWPLMKFGCIQEVLTTLRSWKEELAAFITDPSCQSNSRLTFTSQYLDVVKLLSKAWCHVMCPMDLICKESGNLGYILQKLESRLRELQHRFVGLSKEEELHIQELTHVASTLKSSIFDESAIKKLEFFSLKEIIFQKNIKYMDAEVDVGDKYNDWLNPIPFVAGLPVGIPLKIRLHNVPIETKLWVKMTMYEKLREYVYVDLKQFEGCEKAWNVCLRRRLMVLEGMVGPHMNLFIFARKKSILLASRFQLFSDLIGKMVRGCA